MLTARANFVELAFSQPALLLTRRLCNRYDDNPTEEQRAAYEAWINLLPEVLPCGKCADHLDVNLERMPVKNALRSRDEFLRWTWRLHDTVNKSLQKQSGWTEQQTFRYYHLRRTPSETPPPPPVETEPETKTDEEQNDNIDTPIDPQPPVAVVQPPPSPVVVAQPPPPPIVVSQPKPKPPVQSGLPKYFPPPRTMPIQIPKHGKGLPSQTHQPQVRKRRLDYVQRGKTVATRFLPRAKMFHPETFSHTCSAEFRFHKGRREPLRRQCK